MKDLVSVIYDIFITFPWAEFVPFVLFAGAVCIFVKILSEVKKL